MSQNVKVERDIEYRGIAATKPNIIGVPMPKKKIVDYTFDGTSTLYGWSSKTDIGMTLAHATADGGAMTLTLGSTDEDAGELYHNAQWSANKSVGMQVKLKISAITEVCVTCGFVDTPEATDDHVAGEIDNAALRTMTNTNDWVGFTFDTDQTTDAWYVSAVNNDTKGTPVVTVGSLAPVADTYCYLRMQTDTAGNVTFYYGTDPDKIVPVGYLPTAIAYASSNLLAPYIGFITHTATALVCTVSRVTIWQDN